MKQSAIATLVILGVCLFSTAAGIKCYQCYKGDLGMPVPGLKEHKKCHEGKLPDELLVDCSSASATALGRDGSALNASQIESFRRQGGLNVCVKSSAKSDKDQAAVKGCGYEPTPVDECGSISVGPAELNYCECTKDKCNGGETVIPSFVVLALGVIRYIF